jgi:hypothetical protein
MMIKLAVMIMLGVVLAAFGIGPLVYKDHADPQVPPEALRRLKTQLSLDLKIRPLVLQVTEVHMVGDTPDAVEGTGVFRSLFGVPVGQIQIGGQNANHYFDSRKWMTTWVIFLLVEGALGTFVLRRTLR